MMLVYHIPETEYIACIVALHPFDELAKPQADGFRGDIFNFPQFFFGVAVFLRRKFR
jgi:hypothetical protein